jgi:Uncharacterized protein conserved in bacteria (DUF2325)
MRSHLHKLSTDIFGSATAVAGVPPARQLRAFLPSALSEHPSSSHAKKRTRIWELAPSLHCSIIGTCLSASELRQLLVRLKVTDAETASDHDLHGQGVRLAARRESGAKLLQKALDRRHRLAINQFARAKDVTALGVLWADAVQRGEIPGAYWAILTHAAATEVLVRQAFGEVHMLSHLVGAANQADIRRLRQLENENAALTAKLERQQRQLRDGFTARDETIRRLNDLLVRKSAPRKSFPSLSDPADANAREVNEVLAEVSRRLGNETARREQLEQRLTPISDALKIAESARQRAESERDALHQELALVEGRIATLLQPEQCTPADRLDLSGIAVLYVGGRARQIPQLKAIVERTGAEFLHHDGGIEHSPTLLPGLVSRADLAVLPVDCVSHDAAASLKRLCSHAGKPFLPVRTASLSCLLYALLSMGRVSPSRQS